MRTCGLTTMTPYPPLSSGEACGRCSQVGARFHRASGVPMPYLLSKGSRFIARSRLGNVRPTGERFDTESPLLIARSGLGHKAYKRALRRGEPSAQPVITVRGHRI